MVLLACLLAGPASAQLIVVDPGVALAHPTSLGEWVVPGNAQGWTTSGFSMAAASGGMLPGVGSAVTQLSLTKLVNGPDLDLGFNDLLDLRLRLPANFPGDLHVYYGTSFASGIDPARELTVPNARIPKDGAAHVYRFDLGLEVPWRGNLTDLRIELVRVPNAIAAVDYVRTGDLTDENYRPRLTTECPAEGGKTPAKALLGPDQAVHSLESKHFRFLWNDAVAAHASWTANMPHGTLRNAEEVWQVYVKLLGYREPCQATETHGGPRYKINITTWHGGYWAGGDTDNGTTLARFNATPDGLRVDPPTWVLPHELMHAFQLHNTSGYMPGSWWEGHANYGRERYLEHYRALYDANTRSGIEPTYLRCAHQLIAEGRDYYLSWPLFLYLDENPDHLPGLGEGTMVKLWQQTAKNEYPLMTLARLTPGISLPDIIGGFARRELTFHYAHQADIQAALARCGPPVDNAATTRWQITDLVQRPDDPRWWQVPFEMAPMQGAYAIHELVPTGTGAGRTVTVNFRGLPDSARGADWRASFIVISDTGAERYSTLWKGGPNSVMLAANENRVYLSVAGTPARFHVGAPHPDFPGDHDEAKYPYRSAPSKSRFPYEIQVAGATPRQRDNGSSAGLVQHANGGGYRASTATVAPTAYLGPNARVLDAAQVSGNARVQDYAVVSGHAAVSGDAVVSGHAWVRGNALVTDHAKVRDWALVEGGTISGNSRILEHANIKGGTVTDLATAKGSAGSLSGTLSGNAIIDGDYGDFFYGRDLAGRIAFGHQPYVGVPDPFTHALPHGLYASYDFATPHDSRILDQYGVTDGFTVGSPVWVAADGQRKGFLTFDGSTQSVILDRSVADLRGWTFTAWIKPSGGAGNQAVLWLGVDAGQRLYFTPNDGAGRARFSILKGGVERTLTGAALLFGQWTHVAITLDGAAGTLYLNGKVASSGAVAITPDQLLAANTATTPQQNYLARSAGTLLPMFRGALDDVQFYGVALAASDIAAMQPSH